MGVFTPLSSLGQQFKRENARTENHSTEAAEGVANWGGRTPSQTVTTQACDSKNANYAHSMETALHNVY